MQELLNFISNNGFAIVVAGYMMVYNNKTLSSLTDAIKQQTTMLETILNIKKDGDNNE